MTVDEFRLLGESDIIDAFDMRKPKNRLLSFTYFTAFDNTVLVTLPELKKY